MRKARSNSLNLKKLKRAVLVLAVALAAASVACREAKRPANTAAEAPSPAPQPAASSPFDIVDSAVTLKQASFDHARAEHKTKTGDCTVCHERRDNEITPKFPGHSACIDCHQQDFASSASQLCAVCHKTPVEASAELISFPSKLKQFGLKGFSHKTHLDPEKIGGQSTGAPAVECAGCHRFDSRGVEASFPRHAECYACHTHQAGEKLSECSACHAPAHAALRYTRGVGEPFRLYNFKHASHIKQASCARCHRSIEAASEAHADIQQISTARGQRHKSACWSCHTQAREPVCTKCHTGSLPF
ncbi:MAG TPA: hypothetical protein VJQ56_01145 [Blastocatellia bacterium]|nr:hypothetical protein [Blastocatellia bacterium]